MNTVELDLTQLRAFTERLQTVIETETIPTVAEVHRKIILGLTKSGADAAGEIFHPYAPRSIRERELLHLQTDVKDLRRTGGTLDSLALRDNVLTVDDEHQKIALGQMTGVNGKWGYTHRFLDASRDSNDVATKDLTDHIRTLLW